MERFSNPIKLTVLKNIVELGKMYFQLEFIDNLTEFPHFKTELTNTNSSKIRKAFRE